MAALGLQDEFNRFQCPFIVKTPLTPSHSPARSIAPFSVAPMLRLTTPHCRYFYRLLAPQAELYTEMVIAQAFLYGGVESTVRSSWERPVILQLAGSDPHLLGRAAALAQTLGFDGINLNVGCPSERLQALNAGAKAFLDPSNVGQCLAEMKKHCHLPLSIKTRIGIDHHDSEEALWAFIETTHAKSECTHYILHARKAWLSGLNPAQNRRCPPLNYPQVYRVKKKYPHLNIVLNGGLMDLEAAQAQLRDHQLDGVMMGRAIWNDPKLLLKVGSLFFNQPISPLGEHLFASLSQYFQTRTLSPSQWRRALFPLFNLFKSTPWSKEWKKACCALQNDPKQIENFFNFYQKRFFEVEMNILNKK